MATATISLLDWFFGRYGLFGSYSPKPKKQVGKTYINGLDTGLRLRKDQIISITIEGVTYDARLIESVSLELKERKNE